jgi:protocatechuate 3,4-dioxygenase beta subunit
MEPLLVDLQPAVLVPVRGRVLDPDGNPLAGARVRAGRVIVLQSTEFPWGVEAITDASGNYELKGLRQGERLYVYAEKGTLGGIQSKRFLLDKKEPLTLPDLRIPRADQSISGSVKSRNGGSVVGAEVLVVGTSKKAKTDANGHFLLEGLSPGRVSLETKVPGYRLEFPTGTETGAKKVEIYMSPDRDRESAGKSPEVSLEFKTSDGSVADKIAYWWINVGKGWESSGTIHGNAATMTHSRVDPKKSLALVFAARGYAWPKPTLVKPEAFAKPVTIALEPAASVALTGRVVDDDGKPLAGVKVGLSLVLMDDVVHEPWRGFSNLPSPEPPVTGADGRFRVTTLELVLASMDLMPGATVAVYVNKPGYSGVTSRRVTLAMRADTSLGDVRLPVSRRTVTGTVVDADGRPVVGADVKVHDFGDVRTKTAKDGTFRLDAAPHGPLTLIVDADGFPLEYPKVGGDQNAVRVRLREVE